MTYQSHITFDPTTTSASAVLIELQKHQTTKLLRHYNLVAEVKYFELLTSTNHTTDNASDALEALNTLCHQCSTYGFSVIRTKLEVVEEPTDYIYVETHLKLTQPVEIPYYCKHIMLTELVYPTNYSHILTVRAKDNYSMQAILDSLHIPANLIIKTTTEYCIYDSAEHLDYIHI